MITISKWVKHLWESFKNMNTKILSWIGIVVALLLILYLFVMDVIGKIVYDFKFKAIKIVKLSLVAESEVRLTITINIKNFNFFEITIKNLYYEVYHEGSRLAKTSDKDVNKKDIVIPANGVPYSFDQAIDIFINQTHFKLIEKFKSNTPVDLDVKVKAKILGFNFDLKNLKVKV